MRLLFRVVSHTGTGELYTCQQVVACVSVNREGGKEEEEKN